MFVRGLPTGHDKPWIFNFHYCPDTVCEVWVMPVVLKRQFLWDGVSVFYEPLCVKLYCLLGHRKSFLKGITGRKAPWQVRHRYSVAAIGFLMNDYQIVY